MSTFGGFGGFGQNNQQNNTGSGFGGGFGSTNNTNTTNAGGFGSSNTGTGFGNSGGFGSTGATGFGGFGANANNNSNAFGQNKTGFGTPAATSGGSLFGASTATSGSGFGGGFGGAAPATSGFGSTGGGGLFGSQNKTTGFGSTAGTGGGMFGGGGTTSGFGATPAASTGFGTSGTASFNQSTQNNGTGTVPFAEVQEKDGNASGNQLNKFQSVSTMDAYKNFSFEELRVVDYTQGRKQGNPNGQAGAFGASTGFGGFGAGVSTAGGFGTTAPTSGGGLFGSGNTASTGFGQNNTASTGFGGAATTGGGLFGAKPAAPAGGLFGSSAATGQTGGGLFGSSANTNTGFGSTGGGFGANNTSAANTGGLFGSTAAKPAFGGFGSTNTGTGFGATPGGGFGSGAAASAPGGGLFGSSNTTATTGFGGQQPAASGFSFGQNNQSNAQTGQSTGLFGSGGFGQNNQAKPAGGLFGSTATQNPSGGGLFGQSQPATGGGMFGSTNNQAQSGGGLFGANKPAATGGLFSTNNTNSGGLFGNNQQQAGSGNVFGNSTNQQSNGGLFGNKPAGTGLGGSLFGNTGQTQNNNNSLFGNTQQNNQPFGGSFLGSMQGAQQSQQPGQMTASLLQNPYGNDALFANIGSPTQSVGPIATPLNTSQKSKKQAMIPAYKISPANANRLTTPQKRPAGYGFSYSTYGTPGSAITNSPYGYNTLLSPPYGRSLNKSMSTSNLRNSFSAEDTILNPAAFSSTVRGGTGRLKKLTVDKSLNAARRPLFGVSTPEPRKSVSFDTTSFNGPKSKGGAAQGLDGTNDMSPSQGALVRTESPPSEPVTNGKTQSNGTSHGKELAIVPEDESAESSTRQPFQVPRSHKDQAEGGYWMKPTIEEIKAMPRSEAQNFKDFQTGCYGMGQATYSKVDLTTIPLEKVLGDIVKFETRKITVYGENSTVAKPPVGQGLNVPSTITLENSFPRANAGATEVFENRGKRVDKHIERLKKIPETRFINFDRANGTWTFGVAHYTTYGLPDDDEYDDSMLDSSVLPDAPGTPTPARSSTKMLHLSSPPVNSDTSLPSPPESSPDDTFDFKKGKKRRLFPGQFDEEQDDVDMDEEAEDMTGSLQSFLGQRSVGSSVDNTEAMSVASESGLGEDQEMAGSFPKPARTTEPSTAFAPTDSTSVRPKSILKESTYLGTPMKISFGDDWTEQLQRTVSPRKQDRAALRANQSVAFQVPETEPTPKPAQRKQVPFATSMDIVNSLYGLDREEPKPKRTQTRDVRATQQSDDAWHKASNLSWGPHGVLVHTAFRGQSVTTSLTMEEVRDPSKSIPETIVKQQDYSTISLEGEVPRAITCDDFEFIQFAEAVSSTNNIVDLMEHRAWELCHILFDGSGEIPRQRKDKVSEFWKRLVRTDVQEHVARAESLEEKAFAYLTGGLIEEACNALVEGKNFHLATLVAQIGCDTRFKQTMSTQLDSWRHLNVLAEFEDAIRVIYELLAGNTCVSAGKVGAGTEDAILTLNFAERFKLDWRRSFGLRLWYGIAADEDVTEAVLLYRQDLLDGLELVKPVPWFIEQKLEMGWTDDEADTREDLLWSLLQFHAGDSPDLTTAFAPESVSGNPTNSRLSFQLVSLFHARMIGLDANVIVDTSSDTVDALAASYADELANTTHNGTEPFVTTCWVLLHISDASTRAAAIKRLLDMHIMQHAEADRQVTLNKLRELRIPDKWIFQSIALQAHYNQLPVQEAQALMDAGDWHAAHDVVCRIVGPHAVIEQDADALRELLGGLRDGDSKLKAPIKPGNDFHAKWEKGAGIYYDFIEMRDLERQRGQRWKELVGRVARALERVMAEGLQGKELLERAALQIMGAKVAKYAAEGVVEGVGRVEALRLLLTEDQYLEHSRGLALDYFKRLVAAA